MFEFIERLRAKPEKAKKRIAFLCALFVSGVIFVVWLSVVYPNVRQNQAQQEKISSLEPSPTRALSDIISSGFANIGEQFSKIKSLTSRLQTSPDYYSATSTTQ